MDRSLRILFLVDFFSFFGGTEYINYNLLAGLKNLGHEIKVCVGEKLSFDTWADMVREKDVEMFVSPHPYDTSDNLNVHDQFIKNVVDKVIRDWRPDVIFAHPPGKLLIAFLKKHPGLKIPVLAMEYTTPGENTKYWYHPELKDIQNRITAYIAKCDEAEEGLRKYFDYTGKIYRLPNLVAKAPDKYTPVTGDLLSVGCVGRLSPEKGIGFLLGAWKQVVSKVPQAKLHIYGHGLHEQYYQMLTDDLGIRRDVFFEGTFRPITGLNEIAKNHRIFVQPSLFESIPNSMIELMLRKKAIIATDVGGIPELLRPDKGEGILVPPGSTDLLAEGILRLLRDERLTDSMAEKAYMQAMRAYDYDRNIKEYESVFMEIVANH